MLLLSSYWLLVFALFVYVLGRDPIGRAEAERESSRDPGAVGRRALWRTLGTSGACLLGVFGPIGVSGSVAMLLGILAGLVTLARGRAHRLPVSTVLVETLVFACAFGVTAIFAGTPLIWHGLLFGVFSNPDWTGLRRLSPLATQVFGTIAILAVAGRGGNLIVRGVLDHVALDHGEGKAQSALVIEPRQESLGRTIGVLERWLLVLLVVAGGYTALGVLVAAKGFVRVRDAGSDVAARRFAEYVVIGTLASLLVAVALGLLLRVRYWPDAHL